MQPSDEQRIERFVRDPESMPEGQRREARCLIEEDAGARAYADFLQGVYDRLENENWLEGGSPASPSERVEGLVEEVFSEEEERSALSLQPFRPRRNPRPTVLAAETGAPETRMHTGEGRFSVLAVLEAEEEDLLVRVIWDKDTRQARLYVLSELPERRAHALVSFPSLGLDLITDEEGCREFNVPLRISQKHWAGTRAVVRRPVAERAIGPGEEISVPLPGEGTLLGAREEGALRVALEPCGPEVPSYLTATPPDRPARLFDLKAASPLEPDVSPEAPLVLRVYK
ncbi:hypothetical protein GGQ19_000082 [Salinibacter ruber]|uniref:hypothetical protein n=1 Tax=Salinibacter ruber TaxID=146919 RepID=UPI00216A39C0|nr:hypothetical protein [Salinibacter ruber]MCS3748931.1 hypothetical protein [Salinibacter ruber]